MISIILILLGVVGIVGTIWLVPTKIRSAEYPIIKGHEWFRISPEKIESIIGTKIREHVRSSLKVILIWMLGLYRNISKQITVKQVLKKQIRGFLYDHTPTSIRHPSEFWHKVRHTGPTTPIVHTDKKIEHIEIEE